MGMRAQFLIQLAGGAFNLLLLILLTPLLIEILGLATYGLLLIVLSLTVYVGLAEFGLGVAVAQRIAGCALPDDRSAIVGTALAASIGLGVIAGLIFCIMAFPAAGPLLGLDAERAQELASAWPGLFLLGFCVVTLGIPRGALHGMARFTALNVLGVLATASAIIGPAICAVFVSDHLAALILSVALGHLFALMLGLAFCLRAGVRPTVPRRPRRLLADLLAYGGWNTLTGLLHRVSNSIDRPLIGALAGAASVPFFAVPQGLLSRSNIIVAALTSTVFPRLAGASLTAERALLAGLCYRSVCLLAPAYVLGILLLPDLLNLWLGAGFAAHAAVAAVLLALSFWIDAVGAVPYTMLQASGLIHRDAAVAAAIVLPNLLILAPALLVAGVEGAALAAVLRSTAFLAGRVRATAGEGFPLPDVLAQSALVAGSAAAVAGSPDRATSLILGGAFFAASLALAMLRRPAFVDRFFVSLAGVGLAGLRSGRSSRDWRP